MNQDQALRRRVVRLVRDVQSLPYVWPCPPDATSARLNHAGSCASKHALLAEDIAALDIQSTPLLMTGPLVPSVFENDPAFAIGRDLVEVHECLTVLTTWAGPLRVDVTWDRPLIERGLPGTLDWNGESDMALAVGEVGPCWSVPRDQLRESKEALRARLYSPGERRRRDETLRLLAERFAGWRAECA